VGLGRSRHQQCLRHAIWVRRGRPPRIRSRHPSRIYDWDRSREDCLPVGRRLNSKLPGCCKTYIASLESNITRHRLLERLYDAHTGTYTHDERARKIILINEEGKVYMRRAEKICRKIKCCRIAFSPEVAIWIRRVQVYHSILRYHKGNIKNCGDLKRAARRCNIADPLQIPIKEIVLRLEACKKECLFYREHGKRFRRKHLEERKRVAKENKDEEAFARISAIIQREHQRDFWRRLNYVTGEKRTRSATTIQVEGQGGAIMERTTQDTVERGFLAMCITSGTHSREKPRYAMVTSSKTSDTSQIPLPHTPYWMEHTRCLQSLTQQRPSYSPKLQESANSFQKTPCPSQSHPANGNITGR